MMEELGGLTYKDLRKFTLKDPDQNQRLHKELENDGTYSYIYAQHSNDDLARALAEEHGLHIITYSLYDGDEYSDRPVSC